MKLRKTLSQLSVLLLAGLALRAQSTDPVKKAHQSNERKAAGKILDEDVAAFLVKSADARMMDKMEGSMAAKKGTTKAIRRYGQLMVHDQALLLQKIKILAKTTKATLPAGISDKKESGREDLADKNGKDFDRRFLKMMRIDHQRDVEMFTKALELKDKNVSAFARQYLPMIQSHLDKVKALEKTSD